MDAQQLASFREQLQSLRGELLDRAEASRQSAQAEPLDKCALPREARMALLEARQVAVETERRRQLALAQVEAALRRLGNGTYAQCEGCGAQIDPRRLRLDPTLRLCIRCAQIQ